MKKCALFLVCDDKLSFALGNLILQISNYKFIDNILIIFTSNNIKLKNTIKNLDKRVEFIDINNDEIIKRINFDISTNSFTKQYGIMVFARFFALKFIDEYENIILMDVDTVIQDDFSELCDNFPLKWRKGNSLNSKIPCNTEHTYPNGGLICIGRSIKNYINDNYIDYIFSTINEYHKLPSIDEFVWGILAYEFNIPVRILDKNIYNTLPCWDGSRFSKIIHGMSIYKFWKSEASNFLFPQWRLNNDKWNSICEKNDIKEYMNVIFSPTWSENTLFCFEFNYHIYNNLFEIHNDLVPKISINCNFIKIYIKDAPHDFHFEVKKERVMHKIMIHDESNYRFHSKIMKQAFYNMTSKIQNIKISNIDNRIEVFLMSEENKIKDTILYMYSCIKNDIHKYIQLEKTLKELKINI